MTLLETFQTLTSFSPPTKNLKNAPWEAYVDWALNQGLAPLSAYNLEYRLAHAGAPEWARERLLTLYQGTLNDNVMKLVNFKRAIDELEGHRVILFGAASLAEAVYPHVAFRPVLDIRLWVQEASLSALLSALSEQHFKPDARVDNSEGATVVLSDGRTPIYVYTRMLGARRENLESEMFQRASPMRVYGSSLFRLELEDALLIHCLELARAGFDVPMVSFVDLRELILGASSMGGSYSRPVQVEALKLRAKALRLERALYAGLSIVQKLFPETAEVVTSALPPLRSASRALLDRLLVLPVSMPDRTSTLKSGTRLRQLLTGA